LSFIGQAGILTKLKFIIKFRTVNEMVLADSGLRREARQRSYTKDVVEPMEGLMGDFNVRVAGEVSYGKRKYPLFFISPRRIDPLLPNAFISAGVHGREPAGVYALTAFLKENAERYRGKFNIFAMPCINPSGFEDDTRETAGGTDINRDLLSEMPSQETAIVKKAVEGAGVKFAVAIDMHEDRTDDIDEDEADEFVPEDSYFYENSTTLESSIGKSLIEEMEREGITFCKAPEIYGDENDGGMIWGSILNELTEEHTSLQDYLSHFSSHTFTLETPTLLPLEYRKSIQMKMLQAILDRFFKEPAE
jgi:hypothetical protein